MLTVNFFTDQLQSIIKTTQTCLAQTSLFRFPVYGLLSQFVANCIREEMREKKNN